MSITVTKTFTVSIDHTTAHDRIMETLSGNGFSKLTDEQMELHAQNGNLDLFNYSSPIPDSGLVLVGMSSSEYPVTVDVKLSNVPGGTQVAVMAQSIRPAIWFGVPHAGPMGKKWHEACDSAVKFVTDCFTESEFVE